MTTKREAALAKKWADIEAAKKLLRSYGYMVVRPDHNVPKITKPLPGFTLAMLRSHRRMMKAHGLPAPTAPTNGEGDAK